MLSTLIGVAVGTALTMKCYPPSDVPPTYYAAAMIENKEYVGEYYLTGYVDTGNACKDGVYPCEGVTVASNDPQLWHKNIYIEGYGLFYVHDTGGMSKNVLDIFVGSKAEAYAIGGKKAKVYVIEE